MSEQTPTRDYDYLRARDRLAAVLGTGEDADEVLDELRSSHLTVVDATFAETAQEPSPDPLARVQVGDPDPTGRASEMCPLMWESDSPDTPYCCTREAGHPGRHIAGFNGLVRSVVPPLDTSTGEVQP